MELEKEYIEYIAVFSLTMLAVSAAYFFDPYRTFTYLTLVPVTVLFGYTSYISRNGFRKASLLSLSSLIFLVLQDLVSAVAVIAGFGNVFLSALAGGERFRDYFSATAVPLLLSGLLVGAGVFLVASSSPDFRENFRSSASEFVGEQTESIVEQSQLMEKQKDTQASIVRKTSKATVFSTKVYVLNRTRDELRKNPQLASDIDEAFDSAQENIPSRVSNQTRESLDNLTVDISGRTSDAIEGRMRTGLFILAVPAMGILMYSLQPIVGLFTAVFASLFARVGRD